MSTNETLNQLSYYKGKKCIRCGRAYPDTLLNIEGAIHHKGGYECIDRKSCQRKVRKKRGFNTKI